MSLPVCDRVLRRLLPATLAVFAVVAISACEPQPIPTAPGTERVAVFGDSVPAWLISKGSDRGIDTTKFTVIDGTLEACDGAMPTVATRSRTGEVLPVSSACAGGWRSIYPPKLTVPTDRAILMPGMHAMLDHRFDGVWTHPCRSAARNWYRDDIKARLTYLKAAATDVVLVLPAWPGPNSIWIMPSDYVKRADCVREVMADAAAQVGVRTVDLGIYLCPTSPTECKAYRTKDGVHIDEAKAPTVLKWLLTAAVPPT